MKNVTISLADDLAQFVRAHAAKRSLSLSRFIANLLEELRGSEENQSAALARYLSRDWQFDSRGKGWRREELYDRKVLR